MLHWALGLFLLAIVAAFFGFGGVAGTAFGAGKLLLGLFVVLLLVGLFMGFGRSAAV